MNVTGPQKRNSSISEIIRKEFRVYGHKVTLSDLYADGRRCNRPRQVVRKRKYLTRWELVGMVAG